MRFGRRRSFRDCELFMFSLFFWTSSVSLRSNLNFDRRYKEKKNLARNSIRSCRKESNRNDRPAFGRPFSKGKREDLGRDRSSHASRLLSGSDKRELGSKIFTLNIFKFFLKFFPATMWFEMENPNLNDYSEYERFQRSDCYWTSNGSISSGSPVSGEGICSPRRDPRISYSDYGNPLHFPGNQPSENGPPHYFLGYDNGKNYYETEANPTSVVRVVKRRNTANKKERRRTQSINNAFADLRDCIPNVPADTKLSKIKTLRLATSYIGYLMGEFFRLLKKFLKVSGAR